MYKRFILNTTICTVYCKAYSTAISPRPNELVPFTSSVSTVFVFRVLRKTSTSALDAPGNDDRVIRDIKTAD